MWTAEQRREYRSKNKEKINLQNRLWTEKHKTILNARRRVRKNTCSVCGLTCSYSSQRCRSCASKSSAVSQLIGQCLDCSVSIDYRAKRCKDCSKNFKNSNRTVSSENLGRIICLKCKNIGYLQKLSFSNKTNLTTYPSQYCVAHHANQINSERAHACYIPKELAQQYEELSIHPELIPQKPMLHSPFSIPPESIERELRSTVKYIGKIGSCQKCGKKGYVSKVITTNARTGLYNERLLVSHRNDLPLVDTLCTVAIEDYVGALP